jgi:transposase
MKRFVEEADRSQSTLLPECLDDWINVDNPVRVIDVFVEGLNLAERGFGGVEPEATGRPSYHPSVLLKLYIYGCLNRVQSSRRLEREAGRNFEMMWLLGRLAPDHKTIADFRKDNLQNVAVGHFRLITDVAFRYRRRRTTAVSFWLSLSQNGLFFLHCAPDFSKALPRSIRLVYRLKFVHAA